ncbi:hypothetical protein [Variovorax paradoxus]|uniref:hypothetical protein n=1 Tax=Variovorax paradoxus TaxID=34073 RepID=UPI0019336795|nr:hypothetical protein INQ48_20420 [Variovorax paradoxus]
MNREELRAKILATASPAPVPVNVPEWGDVYVKPLLVGEIETMSSDADPKLQTARGVARMLCDKNGELLFDVNSAEDLFAINRLRASSLNRIHAAMEEVNATSSKAAAELGNG